MDTVLSTLSLDIPTPFSGHTYRIYDYDRPPWAILASADGRIDPTLKPLDAKPNYFSGTLCPKPVASSVASRNTSSSLLLLSAAHQYSVCSSHGHGKNGQGPSSSWFLVGLARKVFLCAGSSLSCVGRGTEGRQLRQSPKLPRISGSS